MSQVTIKISGAETNMFEGIVDESLQLTFTIKNFSQIRAGHIMVYIDGEVSVCGLTEGGFKMLLFSKFQASIINAADGQHLKISHKGINIDITCIQDGERENFTVIE